MLLAEAAAAPPCRAEHAGERTRAERLESPLEFDLVTSRDGFNSLEADWTNLFQRAAAGRHVFQSFNWLWHWANHYLAGEGAPRLAILTARRYGRLVLVWPLVAESHARVTKLSWMGEPMSQYGDVLIEPSADAEAVLAASWQRLIATASADLIQLRKVRADASVTPLLERLGATVTQRSTACFLDMTLLPTFEAFTAATPNSRLKRRRWSRRRLADMGSIERVTLTAGPEARRLAREAFDLKREWLRTRGLISLAVNDPRAKAFFSDVAAAESHPAGALVEALLCNGEAAAIEIGIEAKAHHAVHIVTYAPAYEKASAGALLFEDSIRHAYEQGQTVYDFLAPGDDYKRKWTNQAIETRDWAKATTLKGELYARIYLGFVREVGREAVKALPLALRQRISNRL